MMNRRQLMVGAAATPVAKGTKAEAAGVRELLEALTAALEQRHGGRWTAHIDEQNLFVLIQASAGRDARK